MRPFTKDEAPFLVNASEHVGCFVGFQGNNKMYWDLKNVDIEPFSDITKAVVAELGSYRFPLTALYFFDILLRKTSSSSSFEVCVMLVGAPEQYRKEAVRRLKKSYLTKKYPGLKMGHWECRPDLQQVVMMASDDDAVPWTTVHHFPGYKICCSGTVPDGGPLDKLGTISYHIVAINKGGDGYCGDSPAASSFSQASSPCDLCQRSHLQCTLGKADDGNCIPCQNLGFECSFVSGPSTFKEKMGVLSHCVTVGGRRYLLAPAHIFLRDEPDKGNDFGNKDHPDSESEYDSDSNSDSDFGSSFNDMLRVGSATPPELESQPASDSATDDNPPDRISNFQSAQRQEKTQPEFPPSIQTPTIPCAEAVSIELDYALIPFPLGEGFDFEAGLSDLVEEAIVKPPPQGDSDATSMGTVERSVWVTTPSQGLMKGTIRARPVMMKLPYGMTFSKLYPVDLPSPVKKGDCGSVVIDHFGKIFGFIVAGTIIGNKAYIVPAVDILKDIHLRFSQVPCSALVSPEPRTAQLQAAKVIQVRMFQPRTAQLRPPRVAQVHMVQQLRAHLRPPLVAEPRIIHWSQREISSIPFFAQDLRKVRGDRHGFQHIGTPSPLIQNIYMGMEDNLTLTLYHDSEAMFTWVVEVTAALGKTNIHLTSPNPTDGLLEFCRPPAAKVVYLRDVQSYELRSYQDAFEHGANLREPGLLRDMITRLETENQELRTENNKLRKDLSAQDAETAADKTELRARAETIRTFEERLATLEETLQAMSSSARLSLET